MFCLPVTFSLATSFPSRNLSLVQTGPTHHCLPALCTFFNATYSSNHFSLHLTLQNYSFAPRVLYILRLLLPYSLLPIYWFFTLLSSSPFEYTLPDSVLLPAGAEPAIFVGPARATCCWCSYSKCCLYCISVNYSFVRAYLWNLAGRNPSNLYWNREALRFHCTC